MSVPGQTLFGTFVVQPSDRGQEFIRVEAVLSGKKSASRARPFPRTARAAANGSRSFPRWSTARRTGSMK